MLVFFTLILLMYAINRLMENFCILKKMVLLLLNIIVFPGLRIMHKLVVDNNFRPFFNHEYFIANLVLSHK